MATQDFSDKIWKELAEKTASAYRMDEAEGAKLLGNRTARLIAAIPFAAGCDHPERTALAHLSTFVLASSESCRRIFDHDRSDDADPLARLAPIADFVGGDRAVIDRGMSLLAVIMTNGYEKDIEKDRKSGEYNPILAGAWKAEETKEKILGETKFTVALDKTMNGNDVRGVFWEG
jgi:hypothetical protein